MDPIELVFSESAFEGPLPLDLVFTDDDGGTGPAHPDVTLLVGGRITGLRGHVGMSAGVRADVGGSFTGLRMRIEARYDVNVDRSAVGGVLARDQEALPAGSALRSRMQEALARGGPVWALWGDARAAGAPVVSRWQEMQRLGAVVRSGDGEALPVAAAVLQRFQEELRLRAPVLAREQDGLRLAGVARDSFQEMLRLRGVTVQGFQQALLCVNTVRSGMVDATARAGVWASRYQDAWPPRPGITPPVVPPDPNEVPCYVPALPVELAFIDDEYDGSVLPVELVFTCGLPGATPGVGVVVPIRRVYMTINSISLLRVDGAVAIPADGFSMSIDVDSWTWQWSASLPGEALPLVMPDTGGDPVDVLATVNGVAYRLVAESVARDRSFGRTRLNVKGRGRAAALDAPYAPVLNHGNTVNRTAQQLMSDVLTLNGVGIGWDVDWTIADWLVPGNVWSHQGSYISALTDIASAAGAYLQPHDTAPTVRVLSRYPSAPWDWAGLTPDFELPSDVVSVEGIDWQRKAVYDRVFVSGTSSGVLGQVTRAGRPGTAVAPMVTHPLITQAAAARQRGRAVLSDTGSQAQISLRLPVLAETGLIKPGALVRYVDAGTTHLGLVRSSSLEWARPTLRQVLSVETHPA